MSTVTADGHQGAEDAARSLHVTWADPVATLQRAFGMETPELLAALTSGRLPKPPIAELLGFDLVEAEPGRVVVALTPQEFHYNAMGVVAAGVTATVLDAAMWIAYQATLPANTIASTINLNVNLVKQLSAASGDVRIEAYVVHAGRTTGTAEARLVDASGKLYAHATSGLVAFGPPAA